MIANEDIHIPLIENIKELVAISEKDIPLIIDAFKPKELTKKEILLHTDEVSNYMRFISDGCLRSYYINESGQEYTVQFGIKGWWINDLYSYLTKTIAQYYIQALQPSTILQVHRDDLDNLFNKIPAIERFFRIKMERAYVANLNRTVKSMSETAESRYLSFIKKYRDIEQNVPQYMVASYLGISPEHLSTIRSNLR